jgi:hypothetical protein
MATVTAKRVFSAMSIIKNRLQNRMGDELIDWLSSYLYRERYFYWYWKWEIHWVKRNAKIIKYFKNSSSRREQIWCIFMFFKMKCINVIDIIFLIKCIFDIAILYMWCPTMQNSWIRHWWNVRWGKHGGLKSYV